MARMKLPATAFALLLFILAAMAGLGAFVLGPSRWSAALAWAAILLLGILAMALVVGAVRRTSPGLAREP